MPGGRGFAHLGDLLVLARLTGQIRVQQLGLQLLGIGLGLSYAVRVIRHRIHPARQRGQPCARVFPPGVDPGSLLSPSLVSNPRSGIHRLQELIVALRGLDLAQQEFHRIHG